MTLVCEIYNGDCQYIETKVFENALELTFYMYSEYGVEFTDAGTIGCDFVASFANDVEMYDVTVEGATAAVQFEEIARLIEFRW